MLVRGNQRSRRLPSVFWGVLLVGLGVHLLGFFMFRVSSNALPKRIEAPAFVAFASFGDGEGAEELVEQSMLFDSAPLLFRVVGARLESCRM